MPFGPTNGPVTFINFIHNVNSQWKVLAKKSGPVINDNTNTKIIVSDFFSWTKTIDDALLYINKPIGALSFTFKGDRIVCR
jgi:hypothetical protein